MYCRLILTMVAGIVSVVTLGASNLYLVYFDWYLASIYYTIGNVSGLVSLLVLGDVESIKSVYKQSISIRLYSLFVLGLLVGHVIYALV